MNENKIKNVDFNICLNENYLSETFLKKHEQLLNQNKLLLNDETYLNNITQLNKITLLLNEELNNDNINKHIEHCYKYIKTKFAISVLMSFIALILYFVFFHIVFDFNYEYTVINEINKMNKFASYIINI